MTAIAIFSGRERRATSRLKAPSPAVPARRDYRERDFGIGYGRSSGYASPRAYASQWNGPQRFRCG